MSPSGTSLYRACAALLHRDILLALRQASRILNPLILFLIVITLLVLALGTERGGARELWAGSVWVAALLSSSLSLEPVFRADFEDGTLEQLLLSHHSPVALVASRIGAHWLLSGAPLVVIVAVLGLVLQLPAPALIALPCSLLLGTPVLSLIGAVMMALAVGLREGSALLALLALPLYVPVLIFGSQAALHALVGVPAQAEFYFLGGMLLLALALAPVATAFALRVRMS